MSSALTVTQSSPPPPSSSASSPDQQAKIQMAALGLSSIGRCVGAASTNSSSTVDHHSSQAYLAAAINERQQQMIQMAALEQQQIIYARKNLVAPSPAVTATALASPPSATSPQHQAYLMNHVIIGQMKAQQQQPHQILESQHQPHLEAHVEGSGVSAEEHHHQVVLPEFAQSSGPPVSGMITTWTPELDSALRQLDAEHSGDWKRIGLRMNLHPDLCRARLEALMDCDEANLSQAERAALVAARERRVRREAEIKTKLEKSKFFRLLRKNKTRAREGEDSASAAAESYDSDGNKGSPRQSKLPLSPASDASSGEESIRSFKRKYEEEIERKENDKSNTSPVSDSKWTPKLIKRSSSSDSYQRTKKVKKQEDVEDVDAGNGPETKCLPNPKFGKESADIESKNMDSKEDFSTNSHRTLPKADYERPKPSLEPLSCNSSSSGSSIPAMTGGEEECDEFNEKGLGTAYSPLGEGELHHGCDHYQVCSSTPKVRYQEGFFFRVTKIFPGKKKESLGFIALPKDITFAKARIKMCYELDLNDNWAFFLPSLGPVSRRQESSLGAMVSWLSVKHKEMAGSRRNPIDIIIVNRH